MTRPTLLAVGGCVLVVLFAGCASHQPAPQPAAPSGGKETVPIVQMSGGSTVASPTSGGATVKKPTRPKGR